ncbi:hypothetical protein GCM10010472_44810 [Pseudonocardia halophobica]|uniref:Uncharacterized protein n=1 Tax=Pseudonocardia halophobica TaxID=29401 RepID=A0A9W6LAN5_9PSEU|nr:DUF6069 family protein [Pseudonocardia halophobica]GLL14541.1 hypothetical protein GCM10017577_56880 [Pseudonocardia halophobica]
MAGGYGSGGGYGTWDRGDETRRLPDHDQYQQYGEQYGDPQYAQEYEPPRAPKPSVDAGRLWAAGIATAIVAALVAMVGTLIVRAVLRIAFNGPASSGALGDSRTVLLCVLSAVAALAATGLAHLLLVSTPRPMTYLTWIVGLVTVVAALLPLLGSAPIGERVANSVIHLVIGLVISSLVAGAGASARRMR